jgi:hypothetical protein
VGSASEKMDATGGVFDHEQHVQPVEQQRVNAEEIGGENPVGLPAKKLPPAGPVAARSGIDVGLLENRPYGTCRTLIAQPGQFTVTAPLTPQEFSAASCKTHRRSSGGVPRGHRCAGLGAESSVASPDPGATARAWPG